MNGRDPEGLADPNAGTRGVDVIEQRDQIAKYLAEVEKETGWGSILSDTLQGSWQTIKKPLSWVEQKRSGIERTLVQTGGGVGRVTAPKVHLQTDAANREAAADIGASDTLLKERATRIQNEGLHKIAEKGGELAGEGAYQLAEAGAVVGVGKTLEGTGLYKDVGGHHVHAKSAFKGIEYDSNLGFSISQDFMREHGWSHQAMTNKQRELFSALAASGTPNTMAQQTRIAVEALEAGGATETEARQLVAKSLRNLRENV